MVIYILNIKLYQFISKKILKRINILCIINYYYLLIHYFYILIFSYSDPILNSIDPTNYISKRYYNSSLTSISSALSTYGGYEKNLNIFTKKYKLNDIVLIDNSPISSKVYFNLIFYL